MNQLALDHTPTEGQAIVKAAHVAADDCARAYHRRKVAGDRRLHVAGCGFEMVAATLADHDDRHLAEAIDRRLS